MMSQQEQLEKKTQNQFNNIKKGAKERRKEKKRKEKTKNKQSLGR
jgi:hypothetical protein